MEGTSQAAIFSISVPVPPFTLNRLISLEGETIWLSLRSEPAYRRTNKTTSKILWPAPPELGLELVSEGFLKGKFASSRGQRWEFPFPAVRHSDSVISQLVLTSSDKKICPSLRCLKNPSGVYFLRKINIQGKCLYFTMLGIGYIFICYVIPLISFLAWNISWFKTAYGFSLYNFLCIIIRLKIF